MIKLTNVNCQRYSNFRPTSTVRGNVEETEYTENCWVQEAHQASLSKEFSRQEYWSGWPFPPPGDLPGMEPESLMSPALAGGFFTTSATWEALILHYISCIGLARKFVQFLSVRWFGKT